MSSSAIPGRVEMMSRHEIRADIQGLRGLAVAAVIANHFSSGLVPNGFLGVDLFFVISGYVIAASLSRANHDRYGDFLLTFYDRRIRRLMPALVVCVGLTAAVGLPFIPPDSGSYAESWKTGIAALFGASNLYLHRKSLDYFATTSEFNLFTQTWSLGVEEQFYLLFPTIFWISGSFRKHVGRSRLFAFLLIGSALSLATAVALERVSYSASFFLVPSRFWELGLGAMAFLSPTSSLRLNPERSSALHTAALGILVVMLFLPGLPRMPSTIVVCVFTAALLVWSPESSLCSRILRTRPLVYAGLISYSLYLWHWSVLAVSRWTIGVRAWTFPFQIVLIWLLASASFYWVEQPLRRRAWLGSQARNLFAGLSAATLCAGLCWVLGTRLKTVIYFGDLASKVANLPSTSSHGGVSRSAEFSSVSSAVADELRVCNLTPHFLTGVAYQPKPNVDANFVARCLGDERPKVVLVGDSFAQVIANHVAFAAKQLDRKFHVLIGYGCPYPLDLANVRSAAASHCEYDARFLRAEIIRNLNYGDVLVLRLFFGKPQYLSFDRPTFERSPASILTAYDQELSLLNQQVQARGARLLIIGANPVLENSPICQSPQWFNQLQQADCRSLLLHSSLLTRYSLEQEQHLDELLSRDLGGAGVIQPTRLFCSSTEKTCSLVRDGEFLWSDDTHLKPAGIDLFYEELLQQLRSAASRAATPIVGR